MKILHVHFLYKIRKNAEHRARKKYGSKLAPPLQGWPASTSQPIVIMLMSHYKFSKLEPQLNNYGHTWAVFLNYK